MNIRRRLQNLECRPFRRAGVQCDDQWILPAEESKKMSNRQKNLCLPLPDESTSEERSHALSLARAAQLIDGESGWLLVRDFALGLHTKYQSDFER